MKSTGILDRFIDWIDEKTGQGSRQIARRTARRGFLGKLGTSLVGLGSLPLLPVVRAFAAEGLEEEGDPQSCDYWRYCALSGTLCSCCGGTENTCPPGSQPSTIAWVGTCRNPVDGRDYLISYNDCCGKPWCYRCDCNRTEREKPLYFPSKSNGVLWCYGGDTKTYHCTVALVVGEAS